MRKATREQVSNFRRLKRDDGTEDDVQVTTLLGGIEEREKSPPPTEDEIKGVEEQLDELRQKLDDANNTANSEESSSTKKKAKGQAKKLQTQIETSTLNLANLNAKARERGGLPRAEGGGEKNKLLHVTRQGCSLSQDGGVPFFFPFIPAFFTCFEL